MPSTTRKLNAAQARALALAEVTYDKLAAALAEAKKARNELRGRFKARIPPSTDPKDADKDVRQVEAGGFRIRVSTFDGGEYFSLKDYREAGHPITPEMEPHVHDGEQREKWTVKALAGPKRPDAIEPGSPGGWNAT